MALNELDDARVNFLQTRCERITWLCSNDSAFEQSWRQTAVSLHDAITRDSSSRIDSENYHLLLFNVAVCCNLLYVVELLELLEQLHE